MITRNTRCALRLLAIIAGATAILATAAFADTTPTTPPAATATTYHGDVTAVTPDTAGGGTITIQKGKKGEPMTFTVTSSTKIKVDKVDSTLDKVPVGDVASIKSADGKTADSIHAHAKHVKTPPPSTTPSTPAPAPTPSPAPTN